MKILESLNINKKFAKCRLQAFMLIGCIALSFTDGTADTLFQKSTAVAIGFGNTRKKLVNWSDCAHQNSADFTKPPYWVDKADNCDLKPASFGLRESGTKHIAVSTKRLAKLFPDIKKGDVVEFQDISTAKAILLTFENRSFRLTYGSPPTPEYILFNQLALAVGLATTGDLRKAGLLLSASHDQLAQGAVPRNSVDPVFFQGSMSDLNTIRKISPRLSDVSFATMVQLAEFRSALEQPPQGVKYPEETPDSYPTTGVISNNIFNFGLGSEVGFVLAPGTSGAYVENNIIRGGTHVLDGITWEHDTFVGSHIVYRGGPVRLSNLLFVNCTFEVINDDSGSRFLNFAANGLPEFPGDRPEPTAMLEMTRPVRSSRFEPGFCETPSPFEVSEPYAADICAGRDRPADVSIVFRNERSSGRGGGLDRAGGQDSRMRLITS